MSPTEKNKQQLKMIQKALNRFPKVVADQAKKHKARQKFLKETFGDVVKQLKKQSAR